MNSMSASYLRYANGIGGQLNVAGASYGPGGYGAHIAYTVVPLELGFILIAATAHGICWTGLHQCASYLESELRRDFPKAVIVRDDDKLQEVAARVIAFVSRIDASLDLPVDI